MYHIKTTGVGKKPTIRAIFRDLTSNDRPLTILDIDWLSFPRLVPRRIFARSPHLQSGRITDNIEDISILGNEQVSIVDIAQAQKALQSSGLEALIHADSALAHSKLFHWKDTQGIHYWLPVLEVLRSIYAKSPEMARALLVYDGWGELVESWAIDENKTLEITCTAQPKISDIPRLAWIASEPPLLRVWKEMERFIPGLSKGISPSISWPFCQALTPKAAIRKNGQHCWVSEINNFVNWPLKYDRLLRHHPSLIREQVDTSLPTKNAPHNKNADLENTSTERTSPETITIRHANHVISRPKKLIHIQTNQYNGIDSIEIIDNLIEKAIALKWSGICGHLEKG